MHIMQDIALVGITLVMGATLVMLFGGGQLIAIMYASRQYRKSMEAWYRRTHKDDPMPEWADMEDK